VGTTVAVIVVAVCGVAVGTPLGASGVSGPTSVGAKPRVPGAGHGVYLGAWVNPKGVSGTGGPASQELAQLRSFDAQAGREMAVLHVYSGWWVPAPTDALDEVSDSYGAIPLLDWGCDDQDKDVATGKDDKLIYAYAQALQRYAKPVFLRWFWEMNLTTSQHAACTNSPSDFTQAWQHIWKLFHGEVAYNGHTIDASNVAFVWCPSVSKSDYADYYPGNGYVDWIAVDGYSRAGQGRPTFPTLFASFYHWAQSEDPDAPIMIAETGSGADAPTDNDAGSIQAAYLSSIGAAVAPNGPMRAVQAVVYFDAVGKAGSWVLQPGPGLNAFKALGRQLTFGEPPPTGLTTSRPSYDR